MKRFIRAALNAAVLVTAAPLAAQAADKVTFVLNWTISGENAAIYCAHNAGLFDNADLDVTIEQGKGSPKARAPTSSRS